MNYRGSYRHLLRNSKAAMLAGIEIYNKPRFDYRDECVVILLLNSWELLLKALISKRGHSIFYSKKHKEPYRTLSWNHAFEKAKEFFPRGLNPLPIRRNLDLLSTFRDNAVHFYNVEDFGILIYSLSQTSIVNYRDLLKMCFSLDLGQDVNWSLLPLGTKPPIDPIEYISGTKKKKSKSITAVRQFVSEIIDAVKEVEAAHSDTGRLLTAFNLSLQSVKKISSADITVGVKASATAASPLIITKTVDPNVSHPLRQKDVLSKIHELQGKHFGPYQFQAIAWKNNLKDQARYCWIAKEGVLTKYSYDTITFIKRLTEADLNAALTDYRAYCAERRRKSKQ